VHGSRKGETWIQGVHLDYEAAIAAGREEARAAAEDAVIEFEASAVEAELRTRGYTQVGTEIWVSAEQVALYVQPAAAH
jgi:hypothetical protein